MGIGGLVGEYVVPVGLVALLMVALLMLLAVLARLGIAPDIWGLVVKRRRLSISVAILALFVAVLITATTKQFKIDHLRGTQDKDLTSRSNLLFDHVTGNDAVTAQLSATWSFTGNVEYGYSYGLTMHPQSSASSPLVAVRPGNTYRYSMYIYTDDSVSSTNAQVRLTWFDQALRVVAWNDSPVLETNSWIGDENGWPLSSWAFRSATYIAPPQAAHVKLEIKSLGPKLLYALSLMLSQEGVYVEPHPNGTQGALAFSFDWESAMGGAIHSKGMTVHDPKGAAEHGQAMRDGADWLNGLFKQHNIKATFYATGYNLLDGNTERRQFSGNQPYKWANSKNGWNTDWWLTHPWYGDDPFGTSKTDPAWYFGDQTRALLQAGHEIAPHTFGHIYVRGTKLQELATDMDEWLATAKSLSVPAPTTFAFPWRSSNSLTANFYKVFWDRGIRAVTRVYPLDMKDQYTVGAVGVYPNMAVMPDFLLGAESAAGGEGAGKPVSGDEGLEVIKQTLSRRGTTSFWQHPEQLAPGMDDVRAAWTKVVSAAADERDKGRLWIATVANITAYQRDVMSITVSLSKEWFGGWKIHVNNTLDKPISGMTLTLPADAARVSSSQVDLRTVYHPQPGVTRVSEAGKPVYPARQIVLQNLKPDASTIDVEWSPGQEPPQ